MISDPTEFEKQTTLSIKTPPASPYMGKLCSIQYSIKYSDSPYIAAVKEFKPHDYTDLKMHKQPQRWFYACKTQTIKFNTTALQGGGASLTHTEAPFLVWELARWGFRKASDFDQQVPNSHIMYGWVCVVPYSWAFHRSIMIKLEKVFWVSRQTSGRLFSFRTFSD